MHIFVSSKAIANRATLFFGTKVLQWVIFLRVAKMSKQQSVYRAQRVAQLDASTLDDDLKNILWEQLTRGIESLPVRVSSFVSRYDAELQAALAAALWAVSFRRTGLRHRARNIRINLQIGRCYTGSDEHGHALRILPASPAVLREK